MLIKSLKINVILALEFNRICKSHCTNYMFSLEMQRLFNNLSCIVKNKLMSLTLVSNSKLSNNFNLHYFKFFNVFDLLTDVLK